MAADFLRSHGINLPDSLSSLQSPENNPSTANLDPHPMDAFPTTGPRHITLFRNVSLPRTAAGTRWDVSVTQRRVDAITPHDAQRKHAHQDEGASGVLEGGGALLTTSLCHPHVHLDKAFLLAHPKYAHLQVSSGGFAEAMEITGKAKAEFEDWDLRERGQRVVDESVAAGVSHMRGFVEVDAGVGLKCLDAGVRLKREAEEAGRCIVQLVAFAQLPLFSTSDGDEGGKVIGGLMETAVAKHGVDVVGSTPYVEGDRQRAQRNVEWMIDLAVAHNKHLDFHLDYHLDAGVEPLIWFVLEKLKEKQWNFKTHLKTIVLAHCTRLTFFSSEEWKRLARAIGDLPLSFVGLPNSDLYMMSDSHGARGTLPVPTIIKDYGLDACLGLNNIGNAFTPHGSCDPMALASAGVGLYQAGTEKDAQLLYECVSTRAKKAIGLDQIRNYDGGREVGDLSLQAVVGDKANRVLYGADKEEWRTRKTVKEVVYLYDGGRGRRVCLGGVLTAEDK